LSRIVDVFYGREKAAQGLSLEEVAPQWDGLATEAGWLCSGRVGPFGMILAMPSSVGLRFPNRVVADCDPDCGDGLGWRSGLLGWCCRIRRSLLRAAGLDDEGRQVSKRVGWRDVFDFDGVSGTLEGIPQAVRSGLEKVTPSRTTVELGIELAAKNGKLTDRPGGGG
jgi:hypothetical protein